MKTKNVIVLLCLSAVAAACSGNLDPWNFDPSQQNSGGYSDESAPVESDPESSGVEVDDEASSEDNVSNTVFDATVNIKYNNSTATCEGNVDGVQVEISGAHVTVTNSGDQRVQYILSGTSSDGGFKLYSSRKQAVHLSGLSLGSKTGAAINIQSKKRTFIVLEGQNSLSDCNVSSSGDYPGQAADEDEKAALFSEGQIIFGGGGSLTVSAVGKAGITSDDYVRFMTGSSVSVTSSNGHGVRGKDAIIVSGGSVNVELSSSATGKKCFSSDSLICMVGGEVALVNKASAGTVDGELTGASCIKADKSFVIQGGTLTLTASGKGCKCINGDDGGFFEGGKVVALATGSNYGSSRNGSSDNSISSKAIKFDGNLEFSGADVTASSSAHEAIESKGLIFITGGCVSATSSDDAINSASTMTISGGVVYACSSGNDGLDANGNLVIKGGTVYAVGCGSPEVGIDANTERNCKLYLEGGNVIALGGIESGSSVSQCTISTSWSKNTIYSLCDGDDAIFTFKTPSSGGSGLFMSSPSLTSGSSYTLKSSATVDGAEAYFDGVLSIGGTATGGSSSKVSASDYSGGGGTGGGGGGMGGGGRPGGH